MRSWKIRMEFLCGPGLSHAAMTPNAARTTAKIISLDAPAWKQRPWRMPADADDPFWPDISSRDALENPVPVNPKNRAGRVLSEIVLIFAAIGVLIFLVEAFLPAP
jgi:hypothetical protein